MSAPLQISVQRHAQTVTVGGRSVYLPRARFELLMALASGGGRAMSMDQLAQALSWRPGSYTLPGTIRTQVHRLRSEVPELTINAVHKVGYVLRGATVAEA